jgi:hypothetical protein
MLSTLRLISVLVSSCVVSAEVQGLNVSSNITSNFTTASHFEVQQFLAGNVLMAPSISDQCKDACDTDAFLQAVTELVSELIAELGSPTTIEEFGSKIGPVINKLITGLYQLACQMRSVLSCFSQNARQCSSMNCGLEMILGAIDLVTLSDEAECLCNSCPAVKYAMGDFAGSVAKNSVEAALSFDVWNFLSTLGGEAKPIAQLPALLQDAVCPMVGAKECLDSQPKCAGLAAGLDEAWQLTGPYVTKYIEEELEKTKADCTSAGVDATLLKFESLVNAEDSLVSKASLSSLVFANVIMVVVTALASAW